MSNGQKISQFTGATTLNDSDLVTIVSNGQNFKVTYGDLKTNLGVTGSLTSTGAALGTPILNNPSGNDYEIRKLEDGNGITFSITAEDGVTAALNIDQDSTGVALIENLATSAPDMASLVAGQGISITKDGSVITLGNTVDPETGLSERVVVTQASDLSGTLDSTKEYFIDGVINMGAQSIEVPPGGLSLTGYNFDLSKLTSSEPNYTMFVSPAGGSGNVLGKDYGVEVTGTDSQVYNIVSATGFDAFEFARVNYNDCTSLGEISGYRQGLEVGSGRFGGKPELTLSGTWLGGYFIDTSIVRGMTDGNYSLFKAGAGFTMNSRFRSNQNIDLPANASFLDFEKSNFVNPSTLQLDGVIITRNGAFDATDTNITPNISESAIVCSWTNNNGMPNTFEGGSIGVSTSTVTTINTIGVFETLAAALWTTQDLQHFDNPAEGQLRHLGNTPREYKIFADFTLESAANDVLSLRVSKWDDSLGGVVTVLDQTRQVNALVGGRDVAFFNININTELDQNDYIFLEVTNNTSVSNVTAEQDSYFIVEAR